MRLIPAAAASLMLAAAPAAVARSFTWSFAADILTLDPHSSNNTFTNAFLDNVFESLVRHNPRLELEPSLATRWEVVSPTVWRFQLRENVRFHGGETFGAEDVVFSWQRLNTPGALARGVLGGVIKEVRATGPLTVEIETQRPFPILLNALTQMHVMDSGWAQANNATAATNLSQREEGAATRTPNGTGPFRVRSREVEGATVLVPHAAWWDSPQHNLTEVTFRPIRNAATRTAALLGGQIDALVELPIQDIPRVEGTAGLQVVQGPELRTIYLGFDHHRDELVYSDVRGRNPLRDIRVRQAIYQAIDVEALRRSVMRNNSWVAGTMASPFLNGAPADINTRTFPFDPDASRRLLAEAGYPDGFSIGLACPNDRYVYDERLCIAISGMLSRVGIRITPQFETLNVWSRRINALDVSMFMLGHAGLPLADSYSTLSEVLRTRTANTAGLNVGRWSNAEFDALVDRVAQEGDETRRRALIREALLVEKREVAHVPLHQQPVVWAARRNIDLAQSPDNRLRLPHVRVN